MNSQSDTIHFETHLEGLESIMLWIRRHAAAVGFLDSNIHKIELALEEALVNVMHHAYQDRKGTIELICNSFPGERIEFIIKDKGPSFNPLLQHQDINPEATLEERTEGGLGIFLYRKYMDEIHYERQGPYNVLTLISFKRPLA